MLARAAIIIVLGFIAYGCMLPAPFRVMDDRISIVDNPAIKSLKNVPTIFREGYFHDQSYYRPLINFSFMLEFQAFKLNSFFYNLDNLLLHIANALLVFFLVSRLTHNTTIGFWTGLLFVIHPIQWEAVCNVPGRAILLGAFFVLSSFVLFLEFYKHQRWFNLPLVLITFFLGLLCKESAGVLPFVLLAYVAIDKSAPLSQKMKYLWPFAIGIVIYVLLRESLGITSLHQTSRAAVVLMGFLTFLRSVITDLRLFIFPVDLHYDRSLPFMVSLGDPQAWGTCLFWILALVIIAFWYQRIHPFVLFLMGWFFIELLPVSQLVTSVGVGAGHISTADHFLYLACIPVFIGMVMAYQWIYERNVKHNFVQPALLKFLAGGFLAFFLLTAVEQSIYASNEFSMISRSLAFEPNNPRVQGEMAMLSVFRNDIPDAEKHFRAATRAEPSNPSYHIGLGTSLCQQGRWIEGLEQYVALDPGKDKAMVEREEKLTMLHLNQEIKAGRNFDARGWLAIGIYDAKTNQPEAAIDAFRRCVHLNPGQPDAWFNMASIYEAEKNWPAASQAYKKLLDLGDATAFQRDFALKHLNVIPQTPGS